MWSLGHCLSLSFLYCNGNFISACDKSVCRNKNPAICEVQIIKMVKKGVGGNLEIIHCFQALDCLKTLEDMKYLRRSGLGEGANIELQ